MKKIIILLILFSNLFIQSYAQCSYRIKKNKDKGDFIIPPKSNFSLTKSNSVKNKFKYQFITIDKLNDVNYYEVIKNLNEAKSYYCKKDKHSSTDTKINSVYIKYDNANSKVTIQIDWSSIIDNHSKDEIKVCIFELAKDLLIEFASHENKEGFNWPISISQSIVEKVFELIPIPQEASLSRYIAQVDKEKSFVLLSPKIKLKVDATDTLTDKNDDWQYRLINSNIIKLLKDSRGNTIQTPFIQFQSKSVGHMPTNNITNKGILQASSADIQLSSTLNQCPFIFLVQNKFKKNSKISNTDCTLCGGKEWNMDECNSVLYHYKTIHKDFHDDGLDKNKIDYSSAFGYRNLITPLINIYLNNNSLDIVLGTTLSQLKLQQNLPKNLKILRLYKGIYKIVNLKSGCDIILLSSDVLKF